MLSSSFLDTAIGIVFVFLRLSLIASAVNEIILSKLSMRVQFLLRGLKTLLDDTTGTGLVSAIYNHGQVFGLFQGKYDPKKPTNLPSYIPTNNFVMAFLGIIFEAPLAIATGLETRALNAAVEAEEAARKTNNPSDIAKAAGLRAKVTAATAAKVAAEQTMKDARAALDNVISAATGEIGLPAATAAALKAAAKADAAVKAAEEATKVAGANLADTAAADKAIQLTKEAEAAKQVKAAAERALTDQASGVQMSVAFQSIKTVASDLASDPASEKVGKPLLEMLNQAGNDIGKLKESLAAWYDSAMDRVSGWYKYHTQWWLFGIGLALAVALNADTVSIVTQLSKDSTLRQSIVAAAQSMPPLRAKQIPPSSSAPGVSTQMLPESGHTSQESSEKPAENGSNPEKPLKNVEQQIEELYQLGIPLGWKGEFEVALTAVPVSWTDPWNWLGLWLAKIFGLLITAVAVSMGAPFWFDLLNKFMVIRSTVKPHEKSREEGSKDKPGDS
jgi:hypothetical protein